MLRLPGAGSAFLWITLTVSKVVGTEDQVKPSLPSLLDPPNFTFTLFPGEEPYWFFFLFQCVGRVSYSAGITAGFSDRIF